MLLENPRTNTRTRTYNLHCISHWHEFWRAHWRSDKNTTNTTVGGRGMWRSRHIARTNRTFYTQICGSIPTWFQELDTGQMVRCVSFIMIRCYSFAAWGGGLGARRTGGVASSHCRGSRNSTLSPHPCIVDVWSWDWEMSGLAAGKKRRCFLLGRMGCWIMITSFETPVDMTFIITFTIFASVASIASFCKLQWGGNS